MQVLSHGYKKPANPDTGDQFFPAMETNIQLMNDHTHDGSATGGGGLLALFTQAISSGGWAAVSGQPGTSSKTITMSATPSLPAGLNFDNCQMEFRLANGTLVYPTIVRVSSTSYTIYTNNVQAYIATYR